MELSLEVQKFLSENVLLWVRANQKYILAAATTRFPPRSIYYFVLEGLLQLNYCDRYEVSSQSLPSLPALYLLHTSPCWDRRAASG
jgi:hypothetical protein